MVFVSTARAISLQSAKLQMRIPSIRFRKGGLPAAGHTSTGSSAAPQVTKAKGKVQAQQRSVGAAPTTVILQELPARFQRKPLSQDEIDYINRGGPA